ncbi:MAG: hypothetical protein MAG794_00366 [Gammaproteobacteria bacterium]|nr:hypothetical protein [Gammaproteobacteria bacterium]
MAFARVLLAALALGSALGAVLVLTTGPASVELGTLWYGYAAESLNLTQALIQRYVHPAIWTHVLLPVLLMPAVSVFTTVSITALLLRLLLSWRYRQPN